MTLQKQTHTNDNKENQLDLIYFYLSTKKGSMTPPGEIPISRDIFLLNQEHINVVIYTNVYIINLLSG
jgi:hypothetical protein